ncbi:MAG: FtsX-like permease family protein, partial [Bryobacteraceae bacterium]
PPPGQMNVTNVRTVMPGYFRTLGIPLVAGRDLTWEDSAPGAPLRFIVSRKLVEQYFAGQNPIGQKISVAMQRENPHAEIIGVVADAQDDKLDGEIRACTYYNYPGLPNGSMTFVVRTTTDPLAASAPAAAAIRALDSLLPVADIRAMDQLLADSLARSRFNTLLLALFAFLAITLAAIGIYGVMSYLVAQRTPEIGLRMALGAGRADVVRMILRRGVLLSVAGAASGLAAAFAATRLLEGLLYGVRPGDPLTLIAAALLLAAVSLAACLLPARRASKVDPLVALRYE